MTDVLSERQPRVGFVGAGRTGTALAVGLRNAGYRVVAAASRSRGSAETLAARVPGCLVCATHQEVANAADMVFVTTPDTAISSVAALVRWRAGQWVVHCSGAHSLELLLPAQRQGAEVASFHPLLTFGSVEQAIKSLPGTTFALEGSGHLLRALEGMASRLGGTAIRLAPGEKPLYHAAAVLSCGYVAALLHQAISLWQRLGLSREAALRGLTHLSMATVEGVQAVGPEAAVTGPIVRGDFATVRKHLEALGNKAPDLVPLYCHLGLASLSMTGDEAQAQEMETLLLEYLRAYEPATPAPFYNPEAVVDLLAML
ncbi:MAG: DUF2520 domain-containing protein [Chloroflexi bacterium]|nr:DUF2520 domain-containing protein [Chloroflexota bacterium]